jgi:hypothetical protein
LNFQAIVGGGDLKRWVQVAEDGGLGFGRVEVGKVVKNRVARIGLANQVGNRFGGQVFPDFSMLPVRVSIGALADQQVNALAELGQLVGIKNVTGNDQAAAGVGQFVGASLSPVQGVVAADLDIADLRWSSMKDEIRQSSNAGK